MACRILDLWCLTLRCLHTESLMETKTICLGQMYMSCFTDNFELLQIDK